MFIFAEIYLGFAPSSSRSRGEVVSSMVETLGRLPEQWKGSYVVSKINLDM